MVSAIQEWINITLSFSLNVLRLLLVACMWDSMTICTMWLHGTTCRTDMTLQWKNITCAINRTSVVRKKCLQWNRPHNLKIPHDHSVQNCHKNDIGTHLSDASWKLCLAFMIGPSITYFLNYNMHIPFDSTICNGRTCDVHSQSMTWNLMQIP